MSSYEIPEHHREVIRVLGSGGPVPPRRLYAQVALAQPASRRRRRGLVLAAVVLGAVAAILWRSR